MTVPSWAGVFASSLFVIGVVGCTGDEAPSTSPEGPSAGASTTTASVPVTKPDLPKPIGSANARTMSLESLETARIDLDSPDWMEVAAQSLWVRLDPGTVVQVDPKRARVEQEIEPTGDEGFSDCQLFGSSGDAIWSCSPYGGHIERISTSTSEVTDDVALPFYRTQGHVPLVSDQLWMIAPTGDSIAGLNPEDNTLGDPIALGAVCSTAAGGDGPLVWVICPFDNQVIRVDTNSGEVTGRLELVEPGQVTVGEDVWIGFKGGVAQVDPQSLSVDAVYDVQLNFGGSMLATDDNVWVRCGDGPFLVGIDPTKQRITAIVTDKNLSSGGNIVAVDGQLWTTAFDDATLVRLMPPNS